MRHPPELTEVRAWLALISYPILIIFILDPIGSNWIRKHHSPVVPPEVRKRSEECGRYLYFLKYGLLLAVLWLLAGGHPGRVIQAASQSRSWQVQILVGTGGAALLLVCKRLLILGSSSLAEAETSHPNLDGPISLWLMLFVAGGFAEEVGRAISVVSLHQNGYAPIWAVLLTATAFTVARISGLPGRIPRGAASMQAEGILGILLRGIFVWCGSWISLFTASVLYNTSYFY